MIHRREYVQHKRGAFAYVTSDMIATVHTPEEYENFKRWIGGQTVSVANDGMTTAIYAWDYERWIREGCKTEQGPTWD